MTPTDIARVAHEINRAYCDSLGDKSQQAWEGAPEWQRKSAIDGVNFHIANPNASPSASHDNWLADKREDGWHYGTVKDPVAKTHPCFVSYDELPQEQRSKDYLFRAVVHALSRTARLRLRRLHNKPRAARQTSAGNPWPQGI